MSPGYHIKDNMSIYFGSLLTYFRRFRSASRSSREDNLGSPHGRISHQQGRTSRQLKSGSRTMRLPTKGPWNFHTFMLALESESRHTSSGITRFHYSPWSRGSSENNGSKRTSAGHSHSTRVNSRRGSGLQRSTSGLRMGAKGGFYHSILRYRRGANRGTRGRKTSCKGGQCFRHHPRPKGGARAITTLGRSPCPCVIRSKTSFPMVAVPPG